MGLYNILDRYSRYLRTSMYIQKIDQSEELDLSLAILSLGLHIIILHFDLEIK